MEPGQRAGKGRRLTSLIFSIVLIASAAWVLLNRQMLQDQIALARYDPPASIEALARDAGLSERGKDLFFVNYPELHGQDSFGKVCGGLGDEQSNVLGCFTGQRIYIYDVPDERLDGVEEVTAAHEMLHSAYVRLSGTDKERVDTLVRQQLEADVAPHVKELIDVYNRLEPGELLNEMHSILATEQRNLSPELEQYFSQYFTDRKTVVTLSDQYREVFDSLRRQQESLADELDRIAQEINSTTEALNQRINDYNASVEAFNRRAGSGELGGDEFDAERAGLEAEQQSIEAAITESGALREEYDSKLQQFESLSVEFSKLRNSINSEPKAPEGVQ